MPIEVRWEDQSKSIVIIERDEKWTWEEFEVSNTQSNELISQVTHQVDLIVEGVDKLPPGYPVRHFRNALKSKPKNLRYLVVVLSNPFGRSIFNAMSQLNQKKTPIMVAAPTSREARDFLKKSTVHV